MSLLFLLTCAVFIGFAFLVIYYDGFFLIIPNWISLGLIAFFPLFAFSTDLSWLDLGLHLGLAGLLFLIFFSFFSIGIMGGGDVKYAPSALLWLGPEAAVPFLLITSIAGGALALMALLTSRFFPKLETFSHSRPALFFAGREVSYGPAIALAAIYSFYLVYLNNAG